MRRPISALLGVSFLLPASVALAQAPGEAVAVAAAPAYVAAPAPAGPRFSVGLGLGAASFSDPEAGEGVEPTTFRGAELAVRFRLRPSIELELVAGGGREVIDGLDGDLAYGAVTVGARYRFRPYAPWDYFVGVGVGGTIVARHEASEQERSDATRGHGQLSAGLERRFGRLAIGAELRLISAGEPAVQMDSILPVEPPPGDVTRSQALVGAAFHLGASVGF